MLTPRCRAAAVLLIALTVTPLAALRAQTASRAGTASPPQGSPRVIERIDRYLDTLSPPFSGTFLMAAGDRLLILEGYGLAERSHGVPNGPETVFHIGSITKLFTAILALRLEQDGRVDLDDPVGTYLPELPPDKGEAITMRHLLLHTSGIPHHFLGVPDYLLRVDQLTHTPREYIELFAGVPLAHAPGEDFTYSSPGYFMLAVALERASGRTYAELLDSLVTAPLGMTRTVPDNGRTVHPDAAYGYMMGLEGLVRAPNENESNRLGAGSLVSTAPDLATLLRAIARRDGRILDPSHWDALLAPHPVRSGMVTAGRSLQLPGRDGAPDLSILQFGGSSYGFSARADVLLEDSAVIVALGNVQEDGSTLQAVIDFAGDILFEELGRIPAGSAEQARRLQLLAPGSAVAPDALRRLTGFYRFENGTFVGIVERQGELFRQLAGEDVNGLLQGFSRLRLIPRAESVFDLEGRPGRQYRFSRSPEGGEVVIEVVANGEVTATARPVGPPLVDLSRFTGSYASVELQRTARVSLEAGRLLARGLFGHDEVRLTPLGRDLLGCDDGFLHVRRYPDGTIRDLRLVTAGLAPGGLGSAFVRR